MITIASININTPDNIKVLYKYLTQYYGEDKATELIRKNKDKLFSQYGLAYQ